jgi:hypothetical protein
MAVGALLLGEKGHQSGKVTPNESGKAQGTIRTMPRRPKTAQGLMPHGMGQ